MTALRVLVTCATPIRLGYGGCSAFAAKVAR
jgi:hypothetical protein